MIVSVEARPIAVPPGSQPRVGVIVPCFNQGRYAAACIESLQAQTHQRWCAVLVDDASTDGLSPAQCAELRSERVQVVLLAANHGRALVRNEGLRHLLDVDYVLTVDCDDVLTPGYIEALVAAMEQAPEAGVSYGTLEYFDDGQARSEAPRTWPDRPWRREAMYLENLIPGPGALFRRAALGATEGWRKDFTLCSGEDYDIWLQVVEAGWQPLWVRRAIYLYRQHPRSFLAQATPDVQVDVDAAILKLHGAHIRKAGIAGEFVSRRLVPSLLRSMRYREWRTARKLARSCFFHAPAAALQAIARHYLDRIGARVRGEGR